MIFIIRAGPYELIQKMDRCFSKEMIGLVNVTSWFV